MLSAEEGSDPILKVHVSSALSLQPSDIVWKDPKLNVISPSSRFVFDASRRAIAIPRVRVEENGTYTIVLQKRVAGNTLISDTTTITLIITSKLIQYFKH